MRLAQATPAAASPGLILPGGGAPRSEEKIKELAKRQETLQKEVSEQPGQGAHLRHLAAPLGARAAPAQRHPTGPGGVPVSRTARSRWRPCRPPRSVCSTSGRTSAPTSASGRRSWPRRATASRPTRSTSATWSSSPSWPGSGSRLAPTRAPSPFPTTPATSPWACAAPWRLGKPLLPKGRAGDKVNLEQATELANQGATADEAVVVEADGSLASLAAALYADFRNAPLFVHPAANPQDVVRKLTSHPAEDRERGAGQAVQHRLRLHRRAQDQVPAGPQGVAGDAHHGGQHPGHRAAAEPCPRPTRRRSLCR